MKFLLVIIAMASTRAFANTHCIKDDDGRILQCIELHVERIERELKSAGTQSGEVCVSDTNTCFLVYKTRNANVTNVVTRSRDMHLLKDLPALDREAGITALSDAEYKQVSFWRKNECDYVYGDDPDLDERFAECGFAQAGCAGGVLFGGHPVVAIIACSYSFYKCTSAFKRMAKWQEQRRKELEELEKAEKEKANNPGAGGGGESGNGDAPAIHPPTGSTGTGGTGNHGAGNGKKPVVTIIHHSLK